MAEHLPPLRLTGAQILRDGELQLRSVGLAEGRLTRGPLPEVDLTGYYILPGIIDLHGDGFEHHMAPRPTAPFPLQAGLASFDREAASHGVTTAYLAQGWSWEGGHRSPDHCEEVLAALQSYQPQALTDLRIQIRAETHLVSETQRLIDLVRRYNVGYVVFNDHLEEGFQMSRVAPTAFAHWARKVGKTPEDLAEAIQIARNARGEVARSLCQLAEAFDQLGVVYGSHDDPDGETRERFRMVGAHVAEFPLTHRAASAAHAMFSHVIMGAPNVVRGQSQAGNASACDLIAAGLCDALVSDYHIPALPLAVWALVDRGFLSLPKAWQMISANPAEILRMADRGKLEPGLRADLVVVDAASRRIEATICAGQLTYLAGEAARRFMAQPRVVSALSDAGQIAAE
jgi:alpha-D-ribose 1-methylphosphonate 5-triphosphate diphosphatase